MRSHGEIKGNNPAFQYSLYQENGCVDLSSQSLLRCATYSVLTRRMLYHARRCPVLTNALLLPERTGHVPTLRRYNPTLLTYAMPYGLERTSHVPLLGSCRKAYCPVP
eukprot:2794290-Rhodomonas_salina.1